MLTVLQRSLLAGPRGTKTWIVGERGKPFTKESFGNEFSDAARAAGIEKSAHGVRKIAATIAAENGATEAELDAIVDKVLAYRPKPKTKPAKKRQRVRKRIQKERL